MKKLLSLLSATLIAGTIIAQSLDTVVVRNLQQQADVWGWFVGKNITSTDSATQKALRRVRAVVQANLPINNWNTNLTVDSLPGKLVVEMYQQVRRADYGEIEDEAETVLANISAKANLTVWLAPYLTSGKPNFIKFRNIGKSYCIDQ